MVRASLSAAFAGALLALGGLAAPAAAQDYTWALNQCLNESKTYSYDQIIAGCTALIQSGRLPPVELSAVTEIRGNAHDEKADYPRAMADYNEALRLNPNSATAYYNRGVSWARQGNERAAAADFTAAIGLNPSLPDAYLQRGYSRGQLGDMAGARADAAKFMQLAPGDARGQQLLDSLAGLDP